MSSCPRPPGNSHHPLGAIHSDLDSAQDTPTAAVSGAGWGSHEGYRTQAESGQRGPGWEGLSTPAVAECLWPAGQWLKGSPCRLTLLDSMPTHSMGGPVGGSGRPWLPMPPPPSVPALPALGVSWVCGGVTLPSCEKTYFSL